MRPHARDEWLGLRAERAEDVLSLIETARPPACGSTRTTAFEPRSVVLRAETLDSQNVIRSPHASDARSLTIAANGVSQPLIDRPRFDQSLDERLAVPE